MSPSDQPTAVRGSEGHRAAVLTVYGAGLFQGLALVAFPAAATILQSPTGFDLSSSEYGALFVPQVLAAILSSLALPRLADRIGLKAMLSIGLAADVAAMALLVLSSGAEGRIRGLPGAPARHRLARHRLRHHSVVPQHLRRRVHARAA